MVVSHVITYTFTLRYVYTVESVIFLWLAHCYVCGYSKGDVTVATCFSY